MKKSTKAQTTARKNKSAQKPARKAPADPPRTRKAEQLRAIPRGQRQEGIAFGRSEIGVPPGDLTDMGCPDCRGVLAVREEGSQGHLAFTCRVGHAFSGESLIKVKEQQLEDSLWMAVEVFEEVTLLHRELADRARLNGVKQMASAYEHRIKRAHMMMGRLRGIIAEDAPASAERKAP
jgi:two-component system chemotaxis response regulator CheB